MEESSACLLRSFSQPPPTCPESSEEDPIRRALTSSVSFGRYASELLEWDKWSAFNQKRYLEEAEKYSKPGSVAEKKAYFEAHYKKIAAKKAASLLEQQSTAVDDVSLGCTTNENDVNSAAEMESGQETEAAEIVEVQGENNLNTVVLLSGDADQQTLPEDRSSEDAQTAGSSEQAEAVGHPPLSAEKDVKRLSNHQMDVKIENPSASGDSASSDKNEPAVSSGKPSSNQRGSKSRSSSVKPNIPIYPRKRDHADNPISSKKTSTQSLEKKKRPIPQALHMSISFPDGAVDTSKTLSSPVSSQKIVDSRLRKSILKTSAESSKPQNLTRASVAGMSHPRITPQLRNSRTKTLLDQSVSGRISKDNKPNSSLLERKPKPMYQNKVKSPTLSSSSFRLRSEERAAKRKEYFQKLEQKLSSEAEKKMCPLRQKGGSNVVWQSVSSLAEAKVSFPSSRKSLSIATKKIPNLPKTERKVASGAQDNNSRPPWRFSVKTDSFRDVAEKNSSKVVTLKKKSKTENTCPNIQLSYV